MKRPPPAGDQFPMPSRGEPVQGRQPAGFDELDYPDEIEVQAEPRVAAVQTALRAIGTPGDSIRCHSLSATGWPVHYVVVRLEDGVWYAGVMRGDKLTLRRL